MTFYLLVGISFPIFIVLSLQGYYILNEETLVALTFITFIILLYDIIGNLMKNSFDNKANSLDNEFNYFFEVKEKSVTDLIEFFQLQKNISKNVIEFYDYINLLLKKLIEIKRAILIQQVLFQLETKFNTVYNNEQAVIQTLQEEILMRVNDICFNVLNTPEGDNIKEIEFRRGLEKLKA